MDKQWHEEIERLVVPEELETLRWADAPKTGLRGLILQPAVLAIAFALIVVVGVLIYMAKTRMGDFPGKDDLIAFVEDAGSVKGAEFESITPTDAGKLDDWFVMKGFEGFSIPTELRAAKAVGCRLGKHDEVLVAQVALDKRNALLLVCRNADLKLGGGESRWYPAFQQDEWAVAVYRGKESVCVLMFKGDSDEMPKFLETLGK